jgi:hypothetical protein
MVIDIVELGTAKYAAGNVNQAVEILRARGIECKKYLKTPGQTAHTDVIFLNSLGKTTSVTVCGDAVEVMNSVGRTVGVIGRKNKGDQFPALMIIG